MFAVVHSDINSLNSDLLNLTGQPYCKKGRSAKVKDGIINKSLRTYLIDRYNIIAIIFSITPKIIFFVKSDILNRTCE
jgi:hypothetical protein